MEKLVSYTSTYKPPTEQECITKIIGCMLAYSLLKWYQPKRKILKRALKYSRILNMHYGK